MSCGPCGKPKKERKEAKMCPCGCGETVENCTCPSDCECRKTTCK